MLGAKSAVLRLVRKLLDHFLVVDDKFIEFKLLISKGSLKLQNVLVKEQNIRLRGGTTFLKLSGSVKCLELSWDVTDSQNSSYGLSLKGLRANLSFFEGEELDFEEEEEGEEQSATKNENSASSDSDTKDESLFGLIHEEWESFVTMVTTNIRQSKFVRELLDPVEIRLVEPRVTIRVPDVLEDNDSAGSSSFVSIGADSLLFVTEKNDGLGHRKFINLCFYANALYINYVQNQESFPILEPWTYTVVGRRSDGMRFVNIGRGYQLIGRSQPRGTSEEDSGDKNKRGLVAYVHWKRIRAIRVIVCQFLNPGKPKQKSKAPPISHSTASPPTDKNKYPEKIILPFLLFAMLLGFIVVIGESAYLNISPRRLRKELMSSVNNSLREILMAIVVIVAIPIGNRLLKRYIPILGSRYFHATKARFHVLKNLPSASFRVPLPYVTVVFGNGTTLSLTEVAILGTMTETKFILSSRRLDVSSPTTPRILASSGIRASSIGTDVQVHIDEIYDIEIPDMVRSTKLIVGTIVRLHNGVVTVKFGDVHGLILPGREKQDGEEKKKMLRRRSTMPSVQGIDETRRAQIRFVVKEEIRRSVEELREMAITFENIPRKRIRKGLVIHDQCFRGSKAVDFMLASNIAANRREAERVGRELQATFSLFSDVTNHEKFKDDYNCVYRFHDGWQLRHWSEPPDPVTWSLINEWKEDPSIPFRYVFSYKKLVLNLWSDRKQFFNAEEGQVFLTPGSLSRALELTCYMSHAKASMMEVWNSRLSFVVHPSLSDEIYKFQCSMDTVSASAGYSLEDWHAFFKPNHSVEEWMESFGLKAETMVEDMVGPTKARRFPFASISPFMIRLKWIPDILVEPFSGTEDTTANDLIKHLVFKVMKRAPGVIRRIPHVIAQEVRGETISVTKDASDRVGLTQVSHMLGSLIGNGEVDGRLIRKRPRILPKVSDFIKIPSYNELLIEAHDVEEDYEPKNVKETEEPGRDVSDEASHD